MSNSQQFESLGKSLLEQHLEEGDSDSVDNTSTSLNTLTYSDIVSLSKLLSTISATSINSIISSRDCTSVMSHIKKIITDLESSGKPLSPSVGAGSTYCEAYKILAFSLYLIAQNSQQSPQSTTRRTNYQNTEEKGMVDYLNRELTRLTDKLKEAQEQIETLKMANIGQESELETLRSTNDALTQELSKTQKATEQYAEQIDTFRQKMSPKKDDGNSARIFVLETDLQASQMKVKDLESTSKRYKEKASKLSKALNEANEQNHQQSVTIENLQMELEKVTVERDELQTKSQNTTEITQLQREIAAKEKEVTNLNLALNQLSGQMDILADDLTSESESKAKLMSLVQRQAAIIIASDRQSKEIQKSLEASKAEQKRLLDLQKQQKQQQDQDNRQNQRSDYSICETLADQIGEDFPRIRGILRDESLEPIDRIISAFNAIQLELPCDPEPKATDSKLIEQNKRILAYMSNLIHFMGQVADNSDIQGWLIDSTGETDFRTELLKQCARVDSFIRQNYAALDESIPEEEVKFTEMLEKMINSCEDRESLIVLQQASLYNDIMRKYSADLNSQCQHLVSDLKQLRFELQQTEDTMTDQLRDTEARLNNEISSERIRRESAERMIKAIENQLRHDDNDCAQKCLNLIAGDVNYEEEEESNEDIAMYTRRLQKKLNQAMKEKAQLQAECDASLAEANQTIKDLKAELDQVQAASDSTIAEAIQQIETLEKETESLSNENENLQAKVDELSDANAKLNDVINEQNESIQEFNEQKEKEIAQIKETFNTQALETAKQHQEEIDQLKQESDEAMVGLAQQAKNQRHEMKGEIKRLNSEVQQQMHRVEEMRSHFEPMLAALRENVREARDAERKAKEDQQKAESDSKDLKSELSSLRIELKMTQMKYATQEDKMKREKSLMETKFRMKELSTETEHQTEIEELKSEASKHEHTIFVKICEQFKDFVDFSQPISQESVIQMLQRVSQTLDKMQKDSNDAALTEAECQEMADILNTRRNELVDSVRNVAKIAQLYKENQERIKSDRQEAAQLLKHAQCANAKEERAREWEQWGRRLHALVTDNFSTGKSSKEIMFVLEEALMGAIGQRQTWRRLEMLRTEKQLLKSEAMKHVTKGSKTVSLTTLMIMTNAIHRLQRQSGHLHCGISVQAPAASQQVTSTKKSQEEAPVQSKKRYPILNIV